MKWTGLEIYNFLSIVEAKLTIADQGLILIEGKNLSSNKFKSNGSGKTSLLESFPYAIYDMTSKGVKADDVVNNKVGKNTAVILIGEQDGHTYRIERYRKHSKNKNKVKLFLNDKEITGKSAAETNKMITQIVGIDFNTFINSVMFSQGNGAGRFALATDKEKKEILEGLVNMGVYSNSQAIAKDRVKAKDNEILAQRKNIERTNWELSQVDQLEQQDQQNYEKTLAVVQQYRDSIKNLTDEMDKYARKYINTAVQLEEEIEGLKRKSETMNMVNVDNYLSTVQFAKDELNDYTNELNRLSTDKNKHLQDYKKIQMATNCPVCGSELDPAHREQEMESIKGKLREVLIQVQLTQPKQQQAQEAFDKANTEYQENKKIADEAIFAYRKVLDDIRTKEQWLTQYNQGLQSYKDRIHNAQETLNTLGELPQPSKREAERESIREKLNAQKEALLALERDKTALETAVKVFSNTGVKSHVLDLVTPFLNEKGNQYLATLSGPDMELNFDTQTKNKDGSVSDKFDLQVRNKAGGENYQSQSEGEKKRADISGALALQDLVMNRADSTTNFVVYDEVFDALDEVGCENVITLLRERLKTVGTIYVITHSEHLKPLFEKSITVTKNKNGESTITEGEHTT